MACRHSQVELSFFAISIRGRCLSAPARKNEPPQYVGGATAIQNRGRQDGAELAGEVRRTAAGSRLDIDHDHSEMEFNLVIRGSGSYVLAGQTYLLKPGALMWHLPGQRHRLMRSPKLEMWVVSFRPDLVEAEWRAELAQQPLKQLPGQELIELDRLLSQVAQDSDDVAVYNAGLAYLIARAGRASRDSPPLSVRPMHPAVTRALLLLRDSAAAISLSELSGAAGTTAPYLSRLLIEHTGRSFVDWRNRIRIDRFMDAYRPGTNLLNAALDAGFGSYARFHHIFNETIGCAPSDWARQADQGGSASAAEGEAEQPVGYGIPSTGTLSARQRWTGLVPLAAPAIAALLGKKFLDRLVAAVGDGRDQKTCPDLDPDLPAAERERLIATFRLQDPAAAEDLGRLIGTHDFAGTYARVLEAYGFAPSQLPNAITALATAVWVAASGGGDPGRAQVDAASRQIRSTLDRTLSRLDHRIGQDALTASICHFAVVYHAIQAARASADPRLLAELGEAARRFAQGAFDGDISRIDLTDRGFVAVKQRSGGRSPAPHSPRVKRS
jgi:AraC-like DNA-binding protein/quercetin dioxygenase-like cupin family protein